MQTITMKLTESELQLLDAIGAWLGTGSRSETLRSGMLVQARRNCRLVDLAERAEAERSRLRSRNVSNSAWQSFKSDTAQA